MITRNLLIPAHKRNHTGEFEILDMFKSAEDELGGPRTALQSSRKPETELDQMIHIQSQGKGVGTTSAFNNGTNMNTFENAA